jgi:acetolactate synthase-1/2/3 large subunit
VSYDKPRYGSDVMVDAINAYGIKYASLNPGSSFRGLHDSLVNYGNGTPEIITCPHEKVAVGLAHGYAKVSGEPMAVILHDVVGLLQGTMGIYYAFVDRCPVLVFGGAGPMDAARRRPNIDWIHSANVQGNAVRDYTKWDDQPYSIEAVPTSVARAYRVAMSEPRGPVYVALDAGLQEDELRDEQIAAIDVDRFRVPSPIGPDPAALEELARYIVDARRPIMIPGYAGRDPRAFDQLVELAELLGIGVVDTHIRCNFPNRHPFNVTPDVIEDADLVFLVDVKDMGKWTQELRSETREIRSLIPRSAKIVDLGFNELGLASWSQDFAALHETDLQITADSSVALPMLIDLSRKLVKDERPERAEEREARRRELAALHEGTAAEWRSLSEEVWNDEPVSTARLAAEVWDVVKGYDWVLTSGTAAGWALKTWDIDRPYRHPGRSLGTATQISIALGVALAHRDQGRLVVDLQPDGDLMYDLGALWVAAHHRIPLLVVMFNNRAYYNDWEHQQRMARLRETALERAHIGMELDDPPPDFATAARALGWHGEGPIERGEDIGPAVARAVDEVLEGRPALVDVVCRPK